MLFFQTLGAPARRPGNGQEDSTGRTPYDTHTAEVHAPREDLIDHFFWRLVEVGAAAVVLSPFIFWVLVRLSRSRGGAAPPGPAA
jgi:hypothetical protein